MQPPSAPPSDTAGAPAAAFVCLEVMRKRSDFLATARGRRASALGLNLQGRDRGDKARPRVGFTATKKVGNAVQRNRAKRRLRALAREVLTGLARPGWDYVIVARPETTAERAWTDLVEDLTSALHRVHGVAR